MSESGRTCTARASAARRPRCPVRGSSFGGFTLIELLVVVAIIAVLISILVPSLTAARDQAKLVLCMSNMRAMSLGVLTYGEEYDSDLPILYNATDSTGAQPGPGYGNGTQLHNYPEWNTHGGQLAAYLGGQSAEIKRTVTQYGRNESGGGGFHVPVTLRKRILSCPGVEGLNREYWPSYGMNLFIAVETNGAFYGAHRYKLSQVRKPAEVMLVADKVSCSNRDGLYMDYTPMHDEAIFQLSALSGLYGDAVPRHTEHDPLSFVDGHTDIMLRCAFGGPYWDWLLPPLVNP